MIKKIEALFLACALLVAVSCDTSKETQQVEKKAEPQAETTSQGVSLSKELIPLFKRSCGVCHSRQSDNEAAIKNQVYYENKEDILGKVGKFIIPGKPEESGLVKVLNQTYPVGDSKIVMPPPESAVQKWKVEELTLFKKWISEGAKDN